MNQIVNDSMDTSQGLLPIVVKIVTGDAISIADSSLKGVKLGASIPDRLFWNKFDKFINGTIVDQNARLKMSARLAENGAKEDNAVRLISYVNKAESMRKIDFLINATRCFLSDFIDIEDFFRICQAITDTLLEDLLFLSERIEEREMEYNHNVQGLITSGLMYMSTVSENPRYSFSPIARDIDRFAVSYNDVAKYPNPTKRSSEEVMISVDPTIDDKVIDKFGKLGFNPVSEEEKVRYEDAAKGIMELGDDEVDKELLGAIKAPGPGR